MVKWKAFWVILMQVYCCYAVGVPEWVRRSGESAEFPEERFVTGFGISDVKGDPGRAFEAARRMSQIAILEKTSVKINSFQKLVVKEISGESRNGYLSVSSVGGVLEVSGLQTRYYHDVNAGRVMAFSWVEREHLKKTNEIFLRRGLNRLSSNLKTARKVLQMGKNSEAARLYSDCEKLVDTLQTRKFLLYLWGVKSALSDSALIVSAKDEVQSFFEQSPENLEMLSWKLVRDLRSRVEIAGKVMVFSDGRAGCTLPGEKLAKSIRERLLYGGVMVSAGAGEDVCVSGIDEVTIRGRQTGAEMAVLCSCIDKGEGISCRAEVIDLNDNGVVASVEALIKRDLLVRRDFDESGEKLELLFWTDRGKGDLVLRGGEELSAFVRVNRPCYLLFLQTLSDGTVVIPDLIYQNYYLDVSRVGKTVQFPDIFTVQPPFGSEILEVFISDRPFPPMQIGYRFIENQRYLTVEGYKPEYRGRGIGAERGRVLISRRINLKTVKGNS